MQKTNSATIAIDSHPFSNHLRTTYDYSGYQVFGLTQTTLGDLLRADATTKFDNGCTIVEIPIPEKVRWESGEIVTPKNYYDGFIKTYNENALIKKILFRSLKCVEISKHKMAFRFAGDAKKTAVILSVPNFCPVKNPDKEDNLNEFSGPYFVKKKALGFSLKQRSGGSLSLDEINFIRIKKPATNKSAYKEKKILQILHLITKMQKIVATGKTFVSMIPACCYKLVGQTV